MRELSLILKFNMSILTNQNLYLSIIIVKALNLALTQNCIFFTSQEKQGTKVIRKAGVTRDDKFLDGKAFFLGRGGGMSS